MADKGSSARRAEEGEKAPKQPKMADRREETRPKQVGQQSVGEGGQGPAEGSASVQGPGFASALGDPQVVQPPGQGYLAQQQAALIPQQHQQGYGLPTAGYPHQGFPMAAPQPAGQVPYNIPPGGQTAANIGQPPALQMSVGGAFGGATIRIQSQALAAGGLVAGASAAAAFAASKVAESAAGVVGAGLAAGVATGLTTLVGFYMSNRQQTDEAIRRAVERERHIQVENIEQGSLLVHVKFLTLAGYWIMRTFNEKIHLGTDRTCLQLLLEDELWRVGWTGPIQVGLEGWWFADEEGQEEEQEEAAGTEEEGEGWEWAGMVEKQSVPPSVTTEGDSGLPEDVSSVAAMSITSAEEVEEGPLKWRRARLQKHKDSPTAQRETKAYRSWEEGAEILTSSGYTDLVGVKALVQGFMLRDLVSPDDTSTVLYGHFGQSFLNLNNAQLKQLMTSQLQADPTDSTCLLLTALQLPYGDSRVQTLQQVVDAVLHHGPGDWLYQHLHHIYGYLGWAIWQSSREASPRPKPTMISQLFKGSDLPTTNLPALAKALSALASSLMYKQDHLNTVYFTAILSKEVSETEAIRQFEHFLRLAPECDYYVPPAHYLLATLYNQQQDRQKVIHHFTRGQQTEANRLPVFLGVPRSTKDPAKKAYEQVMAKKQTNK